MALADLRRIAPPRSGRRGPRAGEGRWALLFLAPTLVGLALLSAGPIVAVLGISLTRWDLLTAVLERLGESATLHEVAEGDHSFAVPKRTGLSGADVEKQIQRAVLEWLDARGM